MTEQFPNRQWGSRTTLFARAAHKFGVTKAGSWLVRTLTPWDRALLNRTDAKFTMLGPIGAPVTLLTTRGRKSGLPRTQPLLYVHDGDVLYVIGSNFGGKHHPAWTVNLLADPSAIVTIAGERIRVQATTVDAPDKKEALFERFVELTAAYADYRTRTTRDLRIFALRRA